MKSSRIELKRVVLANIEDHDGAIESLLRGKDTSRM
jgi:hypothetical protein